MHNFSVYQKFDDIIIIKDGVNFTAGFFNIFWAIYKGVWPLFILIGGALFLRNVIDYKYNYIISAGIFLAVSFFSDLIHEIYAEYLGYKLVDYIYARNYKEAEIKYSERKAMYKDS